MSEQDRFDWNDDVDFDSTADGQEDFDDFQDPIDGFADFDDMSDFENEPEGDAPITDAMSVMDPGESDSESVTDEGPSEDKLAQVKVAAAMNPPKRRRGISAVGLGVLFTVSVLVAGVGVGGAILLAEGVHPASLWNPQSLLQFDQLLNFADHPLNVLYMVAMGIVFLALLGSFKMSKAAAEANRRTAHAEDILDRLTALNLDQQDEWKSQDFAEYAPAEGFVIRTLGAWRLQEARQRRLLGVEGELHRLEKALSTNSRSDLTGRFDHPAVGRLTDEMIRYFDARELAARKLEEYETRDRENSTEIMDTLQGARVWNGSTLDSLGVQCSELDQLVGQMDNLAEHVRKALAGAESTASMTDIIEGIRQDLDNHTSGSADAGRLAPELNDLVDRGSKLAFQIAMEVARLGPRGERLLPMSQSLEDLTTGFRQLADRINDQGGSDAHSPVLKSANRKLETLAALITQGEKAPWQDLAEEVQDFSPATARVSSQLTGLVDGFNMQEDRLVQCGTALAELTGATFDSNSIPRKEPSEAPVSSMDITRPNPIVESSGPSLAPAEATPFATADSPFGSDTASSGFGDQPSGPGLGLDGSTGFSLNPTPDEDMPLSGDDEKVYDLEDFGSAPMTEAEPEESDQVFDLSSFGATPMDEPAVPEQEEVFELSSFDATPMDQANDQEIDQEIGQEVDPADEEVYELSDFGAAPAVADDEVFELSDFGATPAVEDEGVFDLSDFGAQPMN